MRNRTSLGLALALLLGAVNGWATPIPRFETLVAHRSLPKSPLLPKPVSAPPFASTKITRIDTTLHLAPDTGVVDGHVEVELSSLGTTSQIALLLDSGLSVSTATASGKSVTVQNTPTQGYDYATLGITPTVGSGESLVISADYSGTLACKNQGCKMGAPLGFLLENAAIASVIMAARKNEAVITSRTPRRWASRPDSHAVSNTAWLAEIIKPPTVLLRPLSTTRSGP